MWILNLRPIWCPARSTLYADWWIFLTDSKWTTGELSYAHAEIDGICSITKWRSRPIGGVLHEHNRSIDEHERVREDRTEYWSRRFPGRKRHNPSYSDPRVTRYRNGYQGLGVDQLESRTAVEGIVPVKAIGPAPQIKQIPRLGNC